MAVAGSITQPEHSPLELSMRQTGLSFQRTRMSADRTLMSVIRTALSLISFGFTIFQFFQHLENAKMLKGLGRRRESGECSSGWVWACWRSASLPFAVHARPAANA